MFIEPTGNKGRQKGWIEVICGCMFSGKTEERPENHFDANRLNRIVD